MEADENEEIHHLSNWQSLAKPLKKRGDPALLLPAFEFECFTLDTASSTGPYKDSTADDVTKISRGILD
ncbi:hypothetical protein COP2_018482 [Malus domestica]